MIIDDSLAGIAIDAGEVQDALGLDTGGATIVGQREWELLSARLRSIGVAMPRGLPQLGGTQWDPARARNLGFLAGAVSHQDRPIMFVDDDIVFGRCTTLDGIEILAASFGEARRALFRSIRQGAAVAGSRFIGYPDLSLVDQIEFAVQSLGSGDTRREAEAARSLARFPRSEPVVSQASEHDPVSDHAYEGPGGIAAGLMMVGERRYLRGWDQPHIYNEDWLWLLTVMRSGGRLEQCDVAVAHLTGEAPLDIGHLDLQERGEALYEVLARGAGEATGVLPLVTKAVAERRTRVASIAEKAQAWSDAGPRAVDTERGIAALVGVLHDLYARMDDAAASEAIDEWNAWQAGRSQWQACCDALRSRPALVPDALRL
jgi:hypothetical protein